jgi:hypothetical protein
VLSSEAVSTLDFGKAILFWGLEKLFHLGVHLVKAISFREHNTTSSARLLARFWKRFHLGNITRLLRPDSWLHFGKAILYRGLEKLFHLGVHLVKATSFREHNTTSSARILAHSFHSRQSEGITQPHLSENWTF